MQIHHCFLLLNLIQDLSSHYYFCILLFFTLDYNVSSFTANMRFTYNALHNGFRVRIVVIQLVRLVGRSGSLVQREQWMAISKEMNRQRFERGGNNDQSTRSNNDQSTRCCRIKYSFIFHQFQFEEVSLLYYLLVNALYPSQFLGATPPRDFMQTMRF